ncbi:hypothetical protein Tco_0468972 [Tanacetum coccineum]
MVAVGVSTGEAIGDGTVNDIMGDEIGEGMAKGVGETRSEPDDHSGDSGVRTGGAGGSGTNPDPCPTSNVLRI